MSGLVFAASDCTALVSMVLRNASEMELTRWVVLVLIAERTGKACRLCQCRISFKRREAQVCAFYCSVACTRRAEIVRVTSQYRRAGPDFAIDSVDAKTARRSWSLAFSAWGTSRVSNRSKLV